MNSCAYRLFARCGAGLILVLGLPLATLAQGPGNGGPRPGATDAPIDGGVSLLLASGVALGLRRLCKASTSPE